MPLALLLFVLVAVPLAEIATFVVVGSKIGVLATIALVLATAVAGATLLRIQGFGAFARIQARMDRGEMPGRDLVHGLMIMIAGLLLIMPGFITDTLGLLLFIPAVRDGAWRLLRHRIFVTAQTRTYPAGTWPPDAGRGTIDLDADDFSRAEGPDGR